MTQLNSWWSGDPAERYWMEITDRETVGIDVNAPQLDGSGKPHWSYTLVTEAQPGDIVLHWHKHDAGEPALIGWSEVTGPLTADSLTWLARGTRGRARGAAKTVPSYTNDCGGFTPLPTPITLTALRSHEAEIVKVLRTLTQAHAGPLYFPFVFSPKQPMRAAQAYLTKFPADLITAIPALKQLRQATPGSKTTTGSARPTPAGAARHLQDPALRKALERHAVDRAKAHYKGRGATSIFERGAPYDLLVNLAGRDRYVEVKGSSTPVAGVELTINEVIHAGNHAPTDLVVVDEITWTAASGGRYTTTGGVLRIWTDWTPQSSDLSPTRFRYELP